MAEETLSTVDNSELHETSSLQDADALVSRLHVIEDQPLDERAVAFVQLHDELRHMLEGA